MKDKKAAEDDDVPEDILKMLGEDGPCIVAKQVTWNWRVAQGFTEVTMIAHIWGQTLQNAATIVQSVPSHIQQRY